MKNLKQKKLPELKPLFVERMKSLFENEKDFKEYLEILKKEPVRSIRCNTLKISPAELKKKLEDKGWKISQPWKEYPEVMIVEGKIEENRFSELDKIIDNKNNGECVNCDTNIDESIKSGSFINDFSKKSERAKGEASNLINLSPGELGRALEHLLGYYYIQELASMFPVIALHPKKNEIILDLCSAPGSKTTQLAAKMENTGTVIANEISMGRLKILASNLERCGVTNTIITRKDGVAFCKRIKKFNPELKFDKILVDAPCSGEGTLRSSPRTYSMWNIKSVKSLSRLQKQLLKEALEILNPNGELIYSTCTHSPEENEEVVDFILNSEEFKDKLKIEKILLPKETNPRKGIKKWQDKEYAEEIKNSCRIYPQDSNTEGFFLIKIKKLRD